MQNNSPSKYFDIPHEHWGLRGDPLLWKEMRTKMETVAIPTSAYELEKLLHKQFKELTGENAKRGRDIYISRYDVGGMSSGMVNSDFWLDKGFPLIIDRFRKEESY